MRGAPTFAKAHFGHPCPQRGKSLTGLIKIFDALFRPAFAIKKPGRLFYIANSNGLTLCRNALHFLYAKRRFEKTPSPTANTD